MARSGAKARVGYAFAVGLAVATQGLATPTAHAGPTCGDGLCSPEIGESADACATDCLPVHACQRGFAWCCGMGQCVMARQCFGGIHLGGCDCCTQWGMDSLLGTMVCYACTDGTNVFDQFCPIQQQICDCDDRDPETLDERHGDYRGCMNYDPNGIVDDDPDPTCEAPECKETRVTVSAAAPGTVIQLTLPDGSTQPCAGDCVYVLPRAAQTVRFAIEASTCDASSIGFAGPDTCAFDGSGGACTLTEDTAALVVGFQ